MSALDRLKSDMTVASDDPCGKICSVYVKDLALALAVVDVARTYFSEGCRKKQRDQMWQALSKLTEE